MAKIELTPEEEAACSYLDWDDASIGKLVKQTAAEIALFDEGEGRSSIIFHSAALMMIRHAIESNATDMDVKMDGVTLDGGESRIGDWVVRIEKVS